MKIEEHEQAYKEHIEGLNRAVEMGVEENQRNIGYNISQGSIELFAIFQELRRIINSELKNDRTK